MNLLNGFANTTKGLKCDFVPLVFYHSPAGLHSRGCRSSGDSGFQTCGKFAKDLFSQTLVVKLL